MKVIADKSRDAVKRFRVGDHVGFKFAGRYVNGKIVEDRGPLGIGGRRLLSVSIALRPNQLVELPEERLQERFPDDLPSVRTALQNVQHAIRTYNRQLDAEDHDNNPLRLRELRAAIKAAYRELLRTLKSTARPGADLQSLEASIPDEVTSDADAALVNEFLPKMA